MRRPERPTGERPGPTRAAEEAAHAAEVSAAFVLGFAMGVLAALVVLLRWWYGP